MTSPLASRQEDFNSIARTTSHGEQRYPVKGTLIQSADITSTSSSVGHLLLLFLLYTPLFSLCLNICQGTKIGSGKAASGYQYIPEKHQDVAQLARHFNTDLTACGYISERMCECLKQMCVASVWKLGCMTAPTFQTSRYKLDPHSLRKSIKGCSYGSVQDGTCDSYGRWL